jgi:hypothetical protein
MHGVTWHWPVVLTSARVRLTTCPHVRLACYAARQLECGQDAVCTFPLLQFPGYLSAP